LRLSQRRSARVAAGLIALTLIAAGCGGDDGDTAGGGAAGGGGSVIDVSGSSTVAPITTRVSEYFEDESPDVVVNVDGPGTGDGFVLFCEGDTDMSNASRPIKPAEAEDCEANGIEYIELKVAIDGLAVMTNASNDAVECLNYADLYALVGPESQGVGNWADAGELAAELGSDTDLPDADLVIAAPGEESGTYDSFVELVFGDFAEERGEEEETRPDYQSSEDDNVIIQAVEGSPTSFGWVGYAFAEEAENVRLIPIAEEPGGDCVEPTAETIADGTYPLARPLYVYVNADRVEENEDLVSFVDFYLGDDGLAAVSEVGYVQLADDEVEATRSVWESKETGSRDGV
jgi:phosphate transport system substrate-binding protein